MAIQQAYPSHDGIASSWADVDITLQIPEGESIDTADVAAISGESTLEQGVQQGKSGGRPMKRTTGSVSHTASITFYREGHIKFMRGLIANAPTRGNQALIRLVHFDITVEHTPIGSEEIFRRVYKGCHVMSNGKHDMKEGTDADQVEVPLSCAEIVDIVDGVEVVLI